MKANHGRIAWVDVFKFLGIWAIYIGHFGEAAGKVYPFVFTYHVQMFFFAAGFFAVRYLKDSPWVFVRKKTAQLMIPYVCFSLIALIFFTVQNNWDLLQAKDALLGLIFGIRNKIIAGSLWFIPCLYIITIGDYFVRKLVKSQALTLLVAFGLFLVWQTSLPHTPSWFMNVDSAMYFYIYYALGAVSFPLLNRKVTTVTGKAIMLAWTILAFAVATITFFLTANWFYGKLTAHLPLIGKFGLSVAIFNVLMALVIIYCNVTVAKLLSHIAFLGDLGRETLAFCGTEDVIKQAISKLLAMINLKVRLLDPFMTVAFSLLCLLVSYLSLIRFLNAYFPWAAGKH